MGTLNTLSVLPGLNLNNPFSLVKPKNTLPSLQNRLVKSDLQTKKFDVSANIPKQNTVGNPGKNPLSAGAKAGMNFAGNLLGSLSTAGLDPQQASMREGLRNQLSNIPGLSLATGALDALASLGGFGLSNIDQSAASRAGVGAANTAHGLLNSLPGVGAVAGLFGSRTAKAYNSGAVDELASAYGSSALDIDAAQKLSRKNMLFGASKANRFIKEANRQNDIITDINQQNKLAKSNSMAVNILNQNLNNYAGATPQLLLSKKGAKIPELEEIRLFLKKKNEKQEEQEIAKFQLGGKMNLIPEGSLHARKHNLEEINEELKDQITSKGIPVIIKNEGGIEQTAEIEKEEWTLRKELTDKLEDLYKQYSDNPSDDIAIETGKLICYELLKNTDDRSGLIKSVE
ncbi:MAG: hypothetical protein KBT03_08990 [Bacteroidales bacterium]|nr:hypothetical protein [Candidatus Scybalousia scybalohippi]